MYCPKLIPSEFVLIEVHQLLMRIFVVYFSFLNDRSKPSQVFSNLTNLLHLLII